MKVYFSVDLLKINKSKETPIHDQNFQAQNAKFVNQRAKTGIYKRVTNIFDALECKTSIEASKEKAKVKLHIDTHNFKLVIGSKF